MELCNSLGIIVNLEKSSLVPSQFLSYLGGQDRLVDFPGFTDSIEDKKVLLNSRRISVLENSL